MKEIKTKVYSCLIVLATLAGSHQVAAQGTAFAYQGRLNNSGNPANGSYDLTFSLFNAVTGGTQTGNTITNLAVGVTNGLFVVTNDFGAVYNGTAYWLQIGVRTNGGTTFMALSPRQELEPTPYSVYAETAGATPLLNNSGIQNFFGGTLAGNSSVSGIDNIGVGELSLHALTSGTGNTASGFESLNSTTSGSGNTATGSFALGDNILGSDNTADGAGAMGANHNGSDNTAVGYIALSSNSNGSNNVALGYEALMNNQNDSDLVAVGYGALMNDKANGQGSGSGFGENTAVGYESLMLDTNGYDNTGVGFQALAFNSSGNGNTATGAFALLGDFFEFSTGGGNTADGAYSLDINTAGYNNTAVGYKVLPTSISDHDNVGVGVEAFQVLNGGSANTSIGTYTFQSLSAGDMNIGVGYSAGVNLTEGTNNIYIGNPGGSMENGIIRIGASGTQTTTFIAGQVGLGGATPQQTLSLNGGLNIDQSSLNTGTVTDALTFGSGSGEGMGSIRVSGHSDSFGLNFYTDYNKRMTITQSGFVGINTNNPSEALDVNGEFLVVDGLSGVKCYIGDDGNGNDVQVGSLKSGITAVSCYNAADNAYMHVDCSSITIHGGSDLAEPFQISEPGHAEVPRGAVVVIDEAHPGHLKLSDQPYDVRVAGVISGANGIHPGIQMEQQGLLEGGQNVALTGRVYVQADTSNGVINPGDLLTTSGTPGRAMKVSDHARAQGAILGKAMTGLKDGQGMVLVLVTLQ